MFRRLSIIICLVAVTSWSHAGPFGLDMGMSLEQLRQRGTVTALKSPNRYKIENMRDGHPEFESYTAWVSPRHGLCQIRAVGVTIRNDSFGTEIRNRFNNLTRALSSKYGPPKNSYDFLNAGSIWREPREWMMALTKKERSFTHFWQENLPDELAGIMLDTNGLTSDAGYIDLLYEFKNFSACKEERDSVNNRNL